MFGLRENTSFDIDMPQGSGLVEEKKKGSNVPAPLELHVSLDSTPSPVPIYSWTPLPLGHTKHICHCASTSSRGCFICREINRGDVPQYPKPKILGQKWSPSPWSGCCRHGTNSATMRLTSSTSRQYNMCISRSPASIANLACKTQDNHPPNRMCHHRRPLFHLPYPPLGTRLRQFNPPTSSIHSPSTNVPRNQHTRRPDQRQNPRILRHPVLRPCHRPIPRPRQPLYTRWHRPRHRCRCNGPKGMEQNLLSRA